jgi:hypothetical protein
MTINMTAEQIRETARKYKGQYKVLAVRTQEVPFELGKMDYTSHVWIDGDDTGKSINGVCATNIKSDAVIMHAANKKNNYRYGYYFGDYVAIIGGNNYKYGKDKGEVIIKDAVVLEILS